MKLLQSPFFALSAGLLAGCGSGLGWFWTTATAVVSEHRAQAHAAAAAVRPEKPWDFWTPEIENLAKELKEARAAVAQRELAVAQRETRFAAETQEVEKVRAQVEALREDISKRLGDVRAQEQGNLNALAKTYSLLTPKAAVAIFAQMDDPTVARLIGLMKPEIAAAVLEELSRTPGENNANVKRAAEISKRLRLLLPAKPAA